ncbi:MAG: hypothetical protein MI799_08745, partial [Desulfobacterales bacterium]|nr:hypothetical protein [Desulfobacterales bacterium]
MSHNKILGWFLILACIVCIQSGCASPASKKAMITHAVQEARQYNKTVSIKTHGGQEIDGLGRSDISNSDFAAAIEESIIENKL